MAQAKKTQTLKQLTAEKKDIEQSIVNVTKRAAREAATAVTQLENLNKRLVEVDAKIAALPTPVAPPPTDPVPA